MTTHAGIYAELDAILDTRIATLARVDQSIAEKVLASNTYHSRVSDQFDGIDDQAFKDAYARRDKETLKDARPTGALYLINKLVTYLREQSKVRPFHSGAKVVINTHPYQLDTEEINELGQAMIAWTNESAQVEFISLSPKELSPRYIKQSGFSAMLMYEYDNWMSQHYSPDQQEVTLLQDVQIFAPAIFFADKPSDEEIRKIVDRAAHPLHAVEILARSLVGLNLIDVEHFSIIRPTQSKPS